MKTMFSLKLMFAIYVAMESGLEMTLAKPVKSITGKCVFVWIVLFVIT